MKTLFLFFMFCWFQVGAFSQTPTDSVFFSIHYIAQFKNKVEDVRPLTEEKVLDVMAGHTDFYGRWQRKREEITDSIIGSGGQFDEVQQRTANYPRPRQFYSVMENYPHKGERMVIDRVLYPYYYIEPIEPITWKLENRDSVIANYQCHGASCTFRGHKWNVYYTTDIPYSVGPWKLFGLPGVIMYAKDDRGTFIFDAIEVRKGNRTFKTPSLRRVKKCTSAELRKLKIESYKDPDSFMRRMTGQILQGYDANGKPLVHKSKTALFLEN